MVKKMRVLILLLLLGLIQAGCIGYGLPQIMQMKPYTLLRGGDQLGRDQLANRALVASQVVPIKGMHPNEVLTILGQPQQIEVKEKGTSEDWVFVYYKRYKTWPKTDKGTFLVRFYREEVMDVLKMT